MSHKFKERLLYFAVVLIFVTLALGPIIWCVIMALTPEKDIMSRSTQLLPTEFTLTHFKEMLSSHTQAHKTVFNGLKNSLIMAGISIVIGVPVSLGAGYAFSRFNFKGKQLVLHFILITIVIPVFTTIIPIYAYFADYGLLDNQFWIGIIYVSAFIPMNTWIFTNFFNSLPKELWEASIVDGCSEGQIFWHTILPLSYPIIFTSILIIFLMSWNQFQIPMILTTSQNNKVITLVLSEFMTRDTISYGLIAVGGLLSILPPALIAILFRNFLISGLTQGAVEG